MVRCLPILTSVKIHVIWKKIIISCIWIICEHFRKKSVPKNPVQLNFHQMGTSSFNSPSSKMEARYMFINMLTLTCKHTSFDKMACFFLLMGSNCDIFITRNFLINWNLIKGFSNCICFNALIKIIWNKFLSQHFFEEHGIHGINSLYS